MTTILFLLGCALAAAIIGCMLYGLYHVLAALGDLWGAFTE